MESTKCKVYKQAKNTINQKFIENYLHLFLKSDIEGLYNILQSYPYWKVVSQYFWLFPFLDIPVQLFIIIASFKTHHSMDNCWKCEWE